MAASILDQRTSKIRRRLENLDDFAVAAFSACVSERLSVFYRAFSEKESWGDPSLAERAIDAAWQNLTASAYQEPLRPFLERIELGTPGTLTFESAEAVSAHNLCIAIVSTLDWCLRQPGREALAGEFAIETLRVAISQEDTGYVDVGSSPDGLLYEGGLANHPVIMRELGLEEIDLIDLEKRKVSDIDLALKLRKRSQANRLATVQLPLRVPPA